MQKISKYITYEEATISQTAVRKKIVNIPNDDQLANMQKVATEIFDKVREHFDKPIRVSSFFRSEKLNKAIGGSKTSQHVKGQAIDMQGMNGLTNREIFEYIKNNLDFDQLINEYDYSWVHVSYVSKEKNRKQILIIK